MSDNLGGTAVNFSSSGGFSNYFPRPTYQDGHVETYFHRAHLTYPYYSELNVDFNTTTGIYNRIGRAYPDVSANGAHFPAYMNGTLFHFYGASLASPLFASVLTLVRHVCSSCAGRIFTDLCVCFVVERGTRCSWKRPGWFCQPYSISS
jgi:tripeptidyl-peptidase-1